MLGMAWPSWRESVRAKAELTLAKRATIAVMTSESDGPALLAIARRAIGALLSGEPFAPEEGPPSRGVFVTLWSPGHRLRGCIGHMQPAFKDLHQEIASCAVAAATRDPRFAPLPLPELAELELEISIIGKEEKALSEADLDPERYGVVVRRGDRTGVLLPNVEGVQNARQQVDIALRKGGIDRSEPFSAARFEVQKLQEAPPAPRGS